jgi:hypothetical protein
MPDFNPQRPQDTREPNRLNRLRSVLMANWLRTAWIGVAIFFFVMVVVPGGLLLYQYSGIGDQQQAGGPEETVQQHAGGPEETVETVTCDASELVAGDGCNFPTLLFWDTRECEAKSRDLVVYADSKEHGPCYVLSEREKEDCAVWVYGTEECIPTAKTVRCDRDGLADRIPHCFFDTSPYAPICYEYYLLRDDETHEVLGSCREPHTKDVRFPSSEPLVPEGLPFPAHW